MIAQRITTPSQAHGASSAKSAGRQAPPSPATDASGQVMDAWVHHLIKRAQIGFAPLNQQSDELSHADAKKKKGKDLMQGPVAQATLPTDS